ncbi:MAG: radical SAM protein [Humidesulfovibrio sp.]|uniref:B12-binding domain-containing radical SAM protein n=1 Tax=Humidesulfovibrio sp. TaxID=2910988 RepID=UPI0027ED265C|nr:radical SAM protein [Humidesulfovibrio sp.]MDQ7834810.1 radical SAM protein [Humidesulfovibrio sp.]
MTAFAARCAELAISQARPRLLLVQPPLVLLKHFSRDIAVKRGYYIFPPTGLQFLFEAVKHRDVETRILDMNYELLKRTAEDSEFEHTRWLESLQESLESWRPQFVGVTCNFDASLAPFLEVLRFVRKFAPGAVLLTGGIIPSFAWKDLLEQNLSDFVTAKEGEQKLNFLLDHLTGEDTGTAPAPGVYFSFQGDFFQTEGDGTLPELNGDLIDSYRAVPIEDYWRYGSLNPYSRMSAHSHTGFAPVQLSRGCRGNCTFCSVREIMGRGVRHRPMEDVLREMEYLAREKDIYHFEWLDDDLLFHKDVFKDLLRGIIERGLKIHWSANNGMVAASIDDELLELMRDSGCIGFKIGIETGNAAMLKRIRKPGTLATFRNLARRLENFPEIFVGGNFIVGFPQENFAEMLDTLSFAMDIRLDWNAFTICQVIRGASAFADFEDYFKTQIQTGGENVKNFIPTRESKDGTLTEDTTHRHGLDIFDLDPASVPDERQIKEIWFTYNMVGNYIFNKNLAPGGRPEKFVSWVEMAQMAYPKNPYMSLFAALGHVLLGNTTRVTEQLQNTKLNVCSDYWKERFEAFGLDFLLRDFPSSPEAVHDALAKLCAHVAKRLPFSLNPTQPE